MPKTILLTGATDGIGLVTAQMLYAQGHHVLLHGRNPEKLQKLERQLSASAGNGTTESFVADLSDLQAVEKLAKEISEKHSTLDVLINNAGVFAVRDPKTSTGLDVRFVVNTLAPFLLTKRLLPLLPADGRVVNLSSAAQAPVSLQTMAGKGNPSDNAAYAQSKLALTMWSRKLGLENTEGPVIVSMNPASLLGSKMVKQAFGIDGGDLKIGADILCRAALSDEFVNAHGQYYDNDSKRFAQPHSDALDDKKVAEVVTQIEALLDSLLP